MVVTQALEIHVEVRNSLAVKNQTRRDMFDLLLISCKTDK